MNKNKESNNVIQSWVSELSMMQQSVLLSGIRGPDGIGKYHKCKDIIRWYRRCILISAFDKIVIDNPISSKGGSFTGPSVTEDECELNTNDEWEVLILPKLNAFLESRDELPFHYFTHFLHSCEVLGYKHPDDRIRKWWRMVYLRLVNTLHLSPETEDEMDIRLGDLKEDWLSRSDEAGSCSH